MRPEGASKKQGPKQVTDQPANHQPATPPQNLPWSEPGGSELQPLTSRNPFLSWYVDSFHCSGNGMYMEESFVADRYQYIEVYLGTIADTQQNIRGLLNVEIYCTS